MKTVDTRYVTANIPAFLIRSLIATLNDLGYATSRLTVGLGVSLEDLADPACRISFRQGREIVLRALRMAQGHALGLETGIREKITSVGLVGYAMLTAATVGEAVNIGLALQKDTGSMLEFDTKDLAEGVGYTAASRFPDPDIYAFLVEEAFASFMGIGRELAGEGFRPLRVDLAYPPPLTRRNTVASSAARSVSANCKMPSSAKRAGTRCPLPAPIRSATGNCSNSSPIAGSKAARRSRSSSRWSARSGKISPGGIRLPMWRRNWE